MIVLPGRLVLASGSPRRRALLESAGVEFVVIPADVDETPFDGETPTDYVARLGVEKAAAVAAPDRVVVAADTTVDLDGRILAKPVDDIDARAMLKALSARTHLVHTGVALAAAGGIGHQVVTTEVRFAALSDAEIDRYVATGEPHDKAGAYAIQGRAACFVEAVHGSVTNIVGLPLAETLAMLRGRAVRER